MADVAIAWSTGKDAALALQAVAADPDLRVAELFTTVEAASGRVRGHGLAGRWPLWGRDTADLAETFLADRPDDVYPCGERGAHGSTYHCCDLVPRPTA